MSYSPNPVPNYMSSDWGNSQLKHTAFQIDAVADKAKFAIQMLETIIDGSDVIEKEIMDASQANVPITREGLRAFAYRIDGQQNQMKQVLNHLKQMMTDIDSKTDRMQGQRTSW